MRTFGNLTLTTSAIEAASDQTKEATMNMRLDDGLPVDSVRFAGCVPRMLDAFGEQRTRYVRVSLDGSHCVMHPSEGDTYLKDARDAGDSSTYVVTDVWLSEREFEDLDEHDGF